MKREDLRKVEFKDLNGNLRNGFFHQWLVVNGEVVIGLVEDEKGFMHKVSKSIRFIKESEE